MKVHALGMNQTRNTNRSSGRAAQRTVPLRVVCVASTPVYPKRASGAIGGNGTPIPIPVPIPSQEVQFQSVEQTDQRPRLSSIYPRGSVCAVVLGGGENDSRRLFPLTDKRTLPAIPVAGSYRLIDVPLSNLINSGVNKVFVLTQYNSTSLNRYLQHTYEWKNTMSRDGFLEVVAATQGPKEQRWAEGPADTVRQWWNMFKGNIHERLIEDVLVLPSDQVYLIDFEEVVDFHRQSLADLTIVCRPVEEKLVDHFGIVKLMAHSTSIDTFEEKPQGDERKALMSMDFEDMEEFINESHVDSVPFLDLETSKHRSWIASTGIMLFRKEALDMLLKRNQRAKDFGREIIPDALKAGLKVVAYNFPGYWTDIGGSIREFFDFNIALANGQVPFTFDDPKNPFYSSWGNLPPNQIQGCTMKNTIISSGCKVIKSQFNSSLIGARSIVGEGCNISDTMIMGADYYEFEKTWPKQVGPQYPAIGIGKNCKIHKAIIDKNARIGHGCELLNKEGVFESMDQLGKGIVIRDGVIIVSKSAVVPDGTCV